MQRCAAVAAEKARIAAEEQAKIEEAERKREEAARIAAEIAARDKAERERQARENALRDQLDIQIEEEQVKAAEEEAAAKEAEKPADRKLKTVVFVCKETRPGENLFFSGGRLGCKEGEENCDIDVDLAEVNGELWPEYERTWKVGANKLMDGKNPTQIYEYSVSAISPRIGQPGPEA